MKHYYLSLCAVLFVMAPAAGFCDEQITVEGQKGYSAGPYSDIYDTFSRVNAIARERGVPLSFQLQTISCTNNPGCNGVSVGIVADGRMTRIAVNAGKPLDIPVRQDWVQQKAQLVRFAPESSQVFVRPIIQLTSQKIDTFSYVDIKDWLNFGSTVMKRAASNGIVFLAKSPTVVEISIAPHNDLTEITAGKRYPLLINKSEAPVSYSLDITKLAKDSQFTTESSTGDVTVVTPEYYHFTL